MNIVFLPLLKKIEKGEFGTLLASFGVITVIIFLWNYSVIKVPLNRYLYAWALVKAVYLNTAD